MRLIASASRGLAPRSTGCIHPVSWHERRVQDTGHVMKGALRTLNVLNAPFMTSAMS